MKALIDGGILLFRASMACEHKEYIAYAKGLEHEGPIKTLPYKRDMKKWMETEGYDEDDITLDIRQLIEPLNYGKAIIKHTVAKILRRTQSNEYTIYLSKSGASQYRKMFVPEYKANRKDQKRPYWEEQLRLYLQEHYDVATIDGWYEDDDWLGIDQKGDETVICTIDKDLDMIPGWHYNWVKDEDESQAPEMYYVTEAGGRAFFYKQLIIGDTADNVKGVPGKGQAYANKVIHEDMTYSDMYQAVRDTYIDYFGDGADAALAINATALWILQEEDCYWMPPTIRHD